MFRQLPLASLIVLSIPLMTLADVQSGPAVGAEIKPLTVEAVTGEKAGKKLDYAAERADKPTIYVFLHSEKFDRPAGRFLKKLDDAVKSHQEKVTIVAVWLTDTPEPAKTRLTAIQQSLQFGVTSLSIHPNLKELPDGWALNTDATVTVVVAAKKKVAADFAYRSIDESAVREVMAELEKVVK